MRSVSAAGAEKLLPAQPVRTQITSPSQRRRPTVPKAKELPVRHAMLHPRPSHLQQRQPTPLAARQRTRFPPAVLPAAHQATRAEAVRMVTRLATTTIPAVARAPTAAPAV